MAEFKFEPINFTGLTIQSSDGYVVLSQEDPSNGRLNIIDFPMRLAYQVGLAISECGEEANREEEKGDRNG